MTNYSKAKVVNKNNIEIKDNDIFINNIKLGGPFIYKFFGKNCVFSDKHKISILSYFMDSKDLISTYYDKKSNEFRVLFKKEILKQINIPHDPEKDKFFTVYYNFDSLLNLQAHAFKHCITDYWKNKGLKVPEILEKDKIFFNEFWNKFREIDCNFFSDITLSDIDTNEKAKNVFDILRNKSVSKSIEKTKRIKKERKITLNNLKELSILKDDSNAKKNWCIECIRKHDGPKTFLNCWKLFSDNNIHELYLKNIKKWIEKSIQDKKNINFYKNAITNGNLNRYHIHYREAGYNYIDSYALLNNNIFCLVLKEYKRGNYHLQTAFAKKISKNPRNYINQHAHAKKKSNKRKIFNCCHPDNWIDVENLLYGN
jgi:hypothetical protein